MALAHLAQLELSTVLILFHVLLLLVNQMNISALTFPDVLPALAQTFGTKTPKCAYLAHQIPYTTNKLVPVKLLTTNVLEDKFMMQAHRNVFVQLIILIGMEYIVYIVIKE
eukprot:TRINITY_DN26131_c0_g1_i1.p1 TRINITY_DN26131_c0_g1~~TRINITY_DN26131_c0_g1_i1.p1  ORF type:complete len:111 (+),score=11.11 TRINITY_DN26131_c0_g1_i1:122-454(+)